MPIVDAHIRLEFSNRSLVYIFRFSPNGSEAIVQEVKAIFPFTCGYLSLQGHYLVTPWVQQATWLVWDWKSDTWTALRIQEDYSPQHVCIPLNVSLIWLILY